MLDANLKAQLQTYLQKVTRPIEIAVWLDDSPKSAEMKALVEAIAPLSDKIAVVFRDDASERRPSFAIGTPGETPRIRFAGLPMGHEFTSLVLALVSVGNSG